MQKFAFTIFLLSFILYCCLSDNTFNPKTQFKTDTASIHNYLKANNLYEEAVAVTTGSLYIVDSLGAGIYPVLSDSIRVAYTGQYLNHDLSLTQFDIDTVTVLLSSVVYGWQSTIPLITTFSKARLFIPSGQAFGNAPVTIGKNVVPPNSNLVYKIHLLGTKGQHLFSDTTAIASYLQQQGIIPLVDPTGIRYTIDTVGKGTATPTPSDSITATFEGRILGADSIFVGDSTATKVSLKNQIAAWKIILPKLTEGSFVRMYVPSGYGYGSSSPSGKIPVNSNLQYQLKLIKVIP